MIGLLLYLLEKISYRTYFGLSLADELKYFYYRKIGQFKNPERCLCGGIVITMIIYPDGYETSCKSCNQVYAED